MKNSKLGWFAAGGLALCLVLPQAPSKAATWDGDITKSNDTAAYEHSAPKKIKSVATTVKIPSANPVKKIAAVPVSPSDRHTIYHYLPESSAASDTESKLSNLSKEVAGKVYYELKKSGRNYLDAKVAVVAAVPLSDLKRETEFGRLIAEYNLTDLADRGLRVKELRLGKDINILPQTGEFILTRNIGELANDSPALDYVVVSTFTNTRKTLILQGRLVSLKTGLIKTSWRYNLPLNRELLGLLTKDQKPFIIALKGVGK